jgi:hypothetical protein
MFRDLEQVFIRGPSSVAKSVAHRSSLARSLHRGPGPVVYRAKDTKLNRDVAIKVLSSAFDGMRRDSPGSAAKHRFLPRYILSRRNRMIPMTADIRPHQRP